VVTPYLVNPVDSKDIKLPTDGFKAPNILQSTFGNMESDGKSGASRPLPSQGNDKAPDAGMGLLTPASPGQTLPAKPEKPSKNRRSAASDAPAPGFNLN
jgi:pilus assembly protein CpaC